MKAVLALLIVAPATALNLRNGACSCMSWKSVYADHNVKCGQGYELGQAGSAAYERVSAAFLPNTVPTGDGFYDEFCTRMYMQISVPSCFNKRFGTPAEQWCYVSSECRGSSKVKGTDVAIHMCTAGDPLMTSTAPEELNRLAGIDHLEIGLFGKLSYNMDPQKWSEVEAASSLSAATLKKTHTMESYYGLKWTGPHQLTEKATKTFEKTKSDGIPVIFDADNGHGGGTLVVGSKIYAFLPLQGTDGLGYVCVEGCS